MPWSVSLEPLTADVDTHAREPDSWAAGLGFHVNDVNWSMVHVSLLEDSMISVSDVESY